MGNNDMIYNTCPRNYMNQKNRIQSTNILQEISELWRYSSIIPYLQPLGHDGFRIQNVLGFWKET